MPIQEAAPIRNLSSDEIENVSGALKLSVGPFNAKFGEDGLFLSLGIDGVGMFNIDAFGVWIVAGDNVIA